MRQRPPGRVRTDPRGTSANRRRPVRWLREFALWKTPRSPLVTILSVEIACVTSLVFANVYGSASSSDLQRFVLLFCVAAAYAEGGDRIERFRRFIGSGDIPTFANAASLWCFAGALTLPVGLAGAFAALIYAHTLIRSHRHRSAQPYRLVYTGVTEICAAMTAALVLAAIQGGQSGLGQSLLSLFAVIAALATYAVVNQALVVAVVWMVVRPARLRDVMFNSHEQIMELTTLALAVLFAVSVVYAPFLAPAALLLIVVLRRSALVHELQVQATRDAKTGLLNAGAWRHEAERELVRAERLDAPVSVLMIDLDHFKVLNDEHGHPAGDAALKSVAECITDALRGYDAVGRFGGEEFVALLAGADAVQADRVATRLCERIRGLRLEHGGTVTASIGVGVGRSDLHSLDDLVSVADQALYIAKNAGRDRVQTMHAVVDPTLADRVTDF
jgi:diguanylate cyclase (GGDEF)-like protein